MYFFFQPKNLPSVLALNHFDQFYGPLFQNWPSIRLGLLCPHFYCAVANVFSKKIIASEDFLDMNVFNMKEMYHLNLAKVPSSVDDNSTSNFSENIDSQEESINEKIDFSDDEDDEDSSSLVSQEEYMPATKFKNRESELEDYGDYYDINMDYKAQLVPYGTIHFPENWSIFYCQRGQFKKFPSPKTDACGLLSEYQLLFFSKLLKMLTASTFRGG